MNIIYNSSWILVAFIFWIIQWLIIEQDYKIILVILLVYLLWRLVNIQSYKFLLISVSLFIIMIINLSLYLKDYNQSYQEYKIELKGHILPDSIYQTSDNLLFFILKDQNGIRYKCKVYDDDNKIYNQITSDKLYQLIGDYNNGFKSKIDGGFSKRKYLMDQHLKGEIVVKDFKSYKTFKGDLTYYFSKFRWKIINYHITHYPKRLASYLNSLLIGYKGDNFVDNKSYYQTLGISHLFSLSGMHIQLLTIICSLILLRLGLIRSSVNYIISILLVFYYYLTGCNLSTWRSVYQFIGKTFLNSINTASIINLLLLYQLVMHPGKMLSLGAMYSFMISYIFVKNTKFNNIQKMILIIICTLPINCWYFGTINFFQIIWNIINIPIFIYFLMPLLLLVACLEMVFVIPDSFCNICELFLKIYDDVLEYCSSLPYQNITFGKMNEFILLLYIIFLVYLFFQLKYQRKDIYRSILAGIIILILFFNQSYIKFSGSVNFVDVGQGDSIYIEKPCSQGNYLIDTGGLVSFGKDNYKKLSNANYTILPFLRHNGVRKIDKIFLTHIDQDHIGNLLEILKEIKVKTIYFPNGAQNTHKFYKICTQIKRIQSNVHLCPILAPCQIDDFKLLWPINMGTGSNSDSLVMLARFGKHNFLFTGDLGIQEEKQVVSLYPWMKVDILKLGHHGSKTSTSMELLNLINPKLGIISSGLHNRFGHPHMEVIDKLQQKNIKFLNTAINGQISYKWFLNFNKLNWKI